MPTRFYTDRQNDNFQCCRNRIPFAITVGGFYEELVCSLWQIGVGDSTAVRQIIPFFVIPFQFIGERIMLSRDIVGDYKFNGECRLPGFQCDTFRFTDILGQNTCFIIRTDYFVE